MCVAAVAWNAHPRWRLIVVANRDEYHDRPTAPLARWDDTAGLIAGRDLRSGGTWLGVSGEGRMVLVTNYRAPGYPMPDRPSRGGLVTGLLRGDSDPRTVAVDAFNPFNLLHADETGLHFIGNHPEPRHAVLAAGIHGVSNGDFATPWPKALTLGGALADWLRDDSAGFAPLFEALRQQAPLPPHEPALLVPDTHPEPRFAAVFVADPVYGTRSSTVVAVDRDGAGTIIERRFTATGEADGETAFTFRWPADRTPADTTVLA